MAVTAQMSSRDKTDLFCPPFFKEVSIEARVIKGLNLEGHVMVGHVKGLNL